MGGFPAPEEGIELARVAFPGKKKQYKGFKGCKFRELGPVPSVSNGCHLRVVVFIFLWPGINILTWRAKELGVDRFAASHPGSTSKLGSKRRISWAP